MNEPGTRYVVLVRRTAEASVVTRSWVGRPGEQIPVRVRVEGVPEARIRYTLQPSRPWISKPAGYGTFAVTVPENSLGTVGRLLASAAVESASGRTLRLDEAVQVRVVPAVEAAMRLADVSATGQEFRFIVDVSNHAQTPTGLSLATQLPQGWGQEAPSEKWKLPAKSKESIQFCAVPSPEAKPGRYEIRAGLSSPKLPDPLEFSQEVLFLPESFNLLKNPGFEKTDGSPWAINEGGYEIDASQSHGERQSLKLDNSSPSQRSGASQTIVLNQKAARPIVVRGHAKAENVSGPSDSNFSIYVDIYYNDGTPLYGQTIDWQTGTTGWQYGEMTVEPSKPIRNVNVYLLLRGHGGTAWFDDVFVAEDRQQ